MKLNLGCGRDIRDGWVNVDTVALPGVDHVIDFDHAFPLWPIASDSVTYSEGSHVIEHLRNPLPFMEELHRVTEPGGVAVFRCPYGSSDDADEDPTHVRRLFAGSWRYFSQPVYTRADYGYRGDWQPEHVTLIVRDEFAGTPPDELRAMVQCQRNIVDEMVALLRCVKPARPPLHEFVTAPVLTLAVRKAGSGVPAPDLTSPHS